MNELYFPEAIVLDREDANGFDSRYSIYAKGFGKFFAKATSARKITSKLAPHLEPGNLVRIRVVGNGHFQVVDVLKVSSIKCLVSDLYLLNQLLPEHDFEFGVWDLLRKCSPSGLPSGQVVQNYSWPNSVGSPSSQARSGREPFDWKKILRVLGWDPEHGICEVCQVEKPAFFDIGTQGFFGEKCFRQKRFRRDAIEIQ